MWRRTNCWGYAVENDPLQQFMTHREKGNSIAGSHVRVFSRFRDGDCLCNSPALGEVLFRDNSRQKYC